MTSERMTKADQTMLLLSLQKEMVELRRRNKEASRKNEQDIQALRRDKEDMKRKLIEGGSSVVPTNLVGRSFTSPPNPITVEETKNRAPAQEMDDESCPNKSVCTIGIMDYVHRQPFTDTIIRVPLSDKWKGFNKDRYDDMTDPDEHMDVYTTHMSLYIADDVVICRVFPTLLKGRALIRFMKLPPNSVNSFATLMFKFETLFGTSCPHHLTSIALVGIGQEKGESLRILVDRFDKVAMSIQNLILDVSMHHMLVRTDGLNKRGVNCLSKIFAKID